MKDYRIKWVKEWRMNESTPVTTEIINQHLKLHLFCFSFPELSPGYLS